MKLRRHETYKIISAEKKEALLLQRRTKRQELKRSSLSENVVFPGATPAATEFQQQNIPLRSSSYVLKTGYNSKKKSYTYVGQLQSDYVPLKTVPNCKFCGAKKFEYEPPGFCCNNGSIKLVSHEMPVELQNLYLGTTEECKHFRTYIRTYNNMFAFTSLGVNYDKELAKRNRGIYTFRVQGKMYHFINDLLPPSGIAKNLQLYFYENDNELANRMACFEKMHESIVKKLMNILRINPYSIFLKFLIDVPNLSNYNIALKFDSGLDQRVYNLPTTSEVAGYGLKKKSPKLVLHLIFKSTLIETDLK
uniref:Uncharacterized protein isoform X3 n=1 Tax=Nicotiana tabacum TaxID=4097 RepID=A0A1S3XKI2_TOBAC|nr:PREDICTED: uncharacterized protein LOC107765981 isoform X3 [Nicotiana tabacum]